MSATAGGEEVPSEGGAVATPTAQDVLALLREKVPKFQALDPRQRLLSVDLKLELHRHRGGATHLPEQFRRKVWKSQTRPCPRFMPCRDSVPNSHS